jgi:hypothetical protein
MSPNSGESILPAADVQRAVRGVLLPDRLIVYISARELTEDERSAVDAGNKIGIACSRLELPSAAASGASYSMAQDDGIKFAHEWPTRDPLSDEPITMQLRLISREPGVAGYVRSETNNSRLSVRYAITFSGYKDFYDGVARYIEFDASNAAVLAPEVPR